MSQYNKKFNYVDKETGEYIKLKCKLKDNIDESSLSSLFNLMYRAKLDSGFDLKKKLPESSDTGKLIQNFKELVDSHKIDCRNIMECVLREDETVSKEATTFVSQFLGMFDYKEEQRYSFDDYQSMLYLSRIGRGMITNDEFRDMLLADKNGQLLEHVCFKPEAVNQHAKIETQPKAEENKTDNISKFSKKQKVLGFKTQSQKAISAHRIG